MADQVLKPQILWWKLAFLCQFDSIPSFLALGTGSFFLSFFVLNPILQEWSQLELWAVSSLSVFKPCSGCRVWSELCPTACCDLSVIQIWADFSEQQLSFLEPERGKKNPQHKTTNLMKQFFFSFFFSFFCRISWPWGGVAVWEPACGGDTHDSDRVRGRWLLQPDPV